MKFLVPFAVIVMSTAIVVAAPTMPQTAAEIEYFEKEIRPILIERCQSCHGAMKQQGGLRLTSRTAALKGGDSGPVLVAGKPNESLLIHAIEYGRDLKMPPKGKLPPGEIARLRQWIERGAVWPETGKAPAATDATFQISEKQRQWWAFQPVRATAGPDLQSASGEVNEIDRFVLAELEKRSLTLSPAADRRVLIRRATYDLTGLPPTPSEVEAFLADRSPTAFEKVVDRLLASPAYGQRWARHWLDVVRYADYHDGNPAARTASCEPLQAWRYRDWVVASLNRDLPYDQFLVHQIAGDLLPSPIGQEIYADGLVATTFLTNGSWDRGDADKEKMVSDMVDDQVDTIGKAFLGLTLGCARCHHHKFDPLSQHDYYALAGIFYSTHILKDIGTKGGEYALNRVPLVSRAYLNQREQQSNRLSQLQAKLVEHDKKSPKKSEPDVTRTLLVQERDKLQRELLPEPPMAEAAQEGGTVGGLFANIQDVPLHIRGSYTRLGPLVPRRMPQFLAGENQPAIGKGSGRLQLANWIASSKNPLTARVLVNRVWQGHFGQGLVRTPNNFGLTSEPPSHPALLDWLATRFVEDGWSLKKLHKRMMLSATYQQTSQVDEARLTQDPENRLLSRFATRRLEAEAIRDTMLIAAGRLDLAMGGPATDNLDTTRRSLYVQTARWDRSNYATLFDAANPDASDEKRNVSTVAPQALFLMNNPFVLSKARLFAERLFREFPSQEQARILRAYDILFSRPPSPEELAIAQKVLARENAKDAREAWQDYAHVLLCSNELVTLD